MANNITKIVNKSPHWVLISFIQRCYLVSLIRLLSVYTQSIIFEANVVEFTNGHLLITIFAFLYLIGPCVIAHMHECDWVCVCVCVIAGACMSVIESVYACVIVWVNRQSGGIIEWHDYDINLIYPHLWVCGSHVFRLWADDDPDRLIIRMSSFVSDENAKLTKDLYRSRLLLNIFHIWINVLRSKRDMCVAPSSKAIMVKL